MKLRKFTLFALNAVWALPAVVIIRLIRPIVYIRMTNLISDRIGHFVADASMFLVHRHIRASNELTIELYWFPRQTSNEQWARMVRRQLFVHWGVRYLVYFNRLIPGGEEHYLPLPSVSDTGYDINLVRTDICFNFSSDEEEEAKEWLRSRGWKDHEPFVCFHARDSAYLSSHFSYCKSDDRFSYHNYRDTDIDSYTDAINWLVEKGYWVIRLGKVMHKRLSFQHQRVIDYPFVNDQNDLLDIWLSAKCRFFVSTASGPVWIPSIYKVPVVFVNALPLIIGFFWTNRIWVPKHLKWANSGNSLTLMEHCQHNYGLTEEYDNKGINIIDLSPEEITAAVVECEQRVAGTWVENNEDRDLQLRFWEVLCRSSNFYLVNDINDVHPQARAGNAWLKSMGEDFLLYEEYSQ
jgi:putative glycosyltransferase (TIGR04372 family)